MKVSIVITNYNGKESLAKNLPVVLATGADEVIVVDDASTDDSVNFLKSNYPQIRVIVHDKNQRFALTCNTGVKEAKGEIVVLLNNDVSPETNFLVPLLANFADSNVFAVGCKEKDMKDGKIVYSGRSLGEFKKGFLVHWRAEDQNQTDTLWATAGSMAVDRKKWLQLGGMSSLFRPAYWEDIDLSFRAKKLGWKVLFEPKSMVIHQHETTNIPVFGKDGLTKIAYKNQFLFVWKNGDFPLLLQHVFWLPYHFLRASFSGDWSFWQGFVRAVSQLPEVVRERYKIRYE